MNNMHSIPHAFDLNLLLVFRALYQHKSVAKAAESIYISASAFSHALNRLRDVMEDPLFVRMKGEMLPTKKAEEIAPSIFESLALISQQLFQVEPFDPLSSTMEFVIGTTDYTAFCVLPSLMKRLSVIAPNIKIRIMFEQQEALFQSLVLGHVDAVIGYSEQGEMNHSAIVEQLCFSDRYVVVVPKRLYSTMRLEDYVEAKHIRVSAWGEHHGIVDRVLKTMGITRQIALELPNMMVAPYILESSNLIMTLPSKAVEQFRTIHEIDVFDLPIKVPDYTVNLYTLASHQTTSPQSWLSQILLDVFEPANI